jgi:hypothetical protein
MFVQVIVNSSIRLSYVVPNVFTGTRGTRATVMLAIMPVLMGFQLLLQVLTLDITSEPVQPLARPCRRMNHISQMKTCT